MAISVFKTWITGEVLSASDLNSSFTQITSNGEDLGWPATKAKDLDGQELILDSDADTSITASTDDQIDFRIGSSDLIILTDGIYNFKDLDTGTAIGPILKLHRDSSGPDVADFIGALYFDGEDSAGNQDTYASIEAQIDDETSTTEDGTLLLKTIVNSTLTTQVDISSVAFVVTPPQTFTGLTTHGGNVISDTDSTDDIGTTSVRWANVYTDNVGDSGQDLTVLATTVNFPASSILAFNSDDILITASSNTLTVSGGTWATAALTSSTIVASSVITGLTLEATGDTSADDNAAMGYTSAEGLILTGQGSTNDVTIKNDADVTVISILTGTDNVTFGGNVVSDTDSTDDLGTTSVRWSNVYTDNVGDSGQDLTVLATTVNFPAAGILAFNSDDILITASSNTLTVSGGTWATAALTSSTIVASGIVKTDDTTEATSTTDGSLQTDGGLSVVLNTVVGGFLTHAGYISAIKLANTSRDTTTTLADDDDLAGFILPVGSYIIEGMLHVTSSSSTPDFKYIFQVASGTVSDSKVTIHTQQRTGSLELLTGAAITVEQVATITSSLAAILQLGGFITISVAAVIDFQWAQNTSNGTAVNLISGSYIKFTKV